MEQPLIEFVKEVAIEDSESLLKTAKGLKHLCSQYPKMTVIDAVTEYRKNIY